MDKRQLHHYWREFQAVKSWYFLIIALISGVICVVALRSNNEHMVQLRSALYTADQKNDNVEGALNNLRSYVYAHMNTNLANGPDAVYPPIQLKYTYGRLVAAASAQAATADTQNTELYSEAQAYCELQDPTDFSGHNRVPCIENYVSTHGSTAAPTTPQIPDDLYKFDFASPVWSPDLAGWSMLITILSAICFVVLFALQRWFKKHVTS